MTMVYPPDRDVQLHGAVPGAVGVAGAGEAHLPAALGAHLHVRPHPRQHRLRGPEHPPGRHPGRGDRSPGEVRVASHIGIVDFFIALYVLYCSTLQKPESEVSDKGGGDGSGGADRLLSHLPGRC